MLLWAAVVVSVSSVEFKFIKALCTKLKIRKSTLGYLFLLRQGKEIFDNESMKACHTWNWILALKLLKQDLAKNIVMNRLLSISISECNWNLGYNSGWKRKCPSSRASSSGLPLLVCYYCYCWLLWSLWPPVDILIPTLENLQFSLLAVIICLPDLFRLCE